MQITITTIVVSSNPAHGEVYLIQHYVIKVVESGVKNYNPNHYEDINDLFNHHYEDFITYFIHFYEDPTTL